MAKPGLLASSLAPVTNLVFPPRCPACGEALGTQDGLCIACWSTLVIPGEPCCRACQIPMPPDAQVPAALCSMCRHAPPAHCGITAATLYGDTARKLLLAFKHGGRMTLAPLMARMIAARLPPTDTPRLLIPVPLHRWRLWRRGYNQAALLAEELAKLGQGTLVVDALERTRATPSLGGLGSGQRREALAGAIRCTARRRALFPDREVILVDDVLTTGATAANCTAALLEAGAAGVRVACFARVEGARKAG